MVSWTTQQWAKIYEERRFALARILPGKKMPVEKGWTTRHVPYRFFTEKDGVGIQSGRLSSDLVCIDLDDHLSIELAPKYLPLTRMVEGRPGKERSHLWFRVRDIPDYLTASRTVAGGLGGPRTRRFLNEAGKTILEFRGTGSQAVVPPSVWKKGGREERRIWHEFVEPLLIDCEELWNATVKLAVACGYKLPVSPIKEPPLRKTPAGLILPPMPEDDMTAVTRTYLLGTAPSVEGKGGNAQLWNVSCVLVRGFDQTPEQALPVLMEWNQTCQPPWPEETLRRQLAAADKCEGKRGEKVKTRSRPIEIDIRPGDTTVYVGADCKGDRSFVCLPTMRAGTVKARRERKLCQMLAGLDWKGKTVILTPPSTITTNKRDCWSEYFLARCLMLAGSREVRTLRISSPDLRRWTLSQAEQAGLTIKMISPPRTATQTREAAERAGELALSLRSRRNSTPRRKPSPKLDQAREFVRREEVTLPLTRNVVKRAKAEGITESTLRDVFSPPL